MSTMLPVMNPKHNIREIAKQMLLLEDHLFQSSKRCHDCIRKHISTIEALAEETVTLDTEGEYIEIATEIAELMRDIGTVLLLNGLGDKLDPNTAHEVACLLRKVRKPLLKDSFDLLLEIKRDKTASVCIHKVASAYMRRMR